MSFFRNFSRKKSKSKRDRKLRDKLQMTMEQAPTDPKSENSFSFYTNVNTEESYLSDESDLSTISEVDLGSARFVNLMSIVNNPENNKKENILSGLKNFVINLSDRRAKRQERRKQRRMLRNVKKVARSISVDGFVGYKEKVFKVKEIRLISFRGA